MFSTARSLALTRSNSSSRFEAGKSTSREDGLADPEDYSDQDLDGIAYDVTLIASKIVALQPTKMVVASSKADGTLHRPAKSCELAISAP